MARIIRSHTHARSQYSTMREVLLQHSSIVNTRGSSSSTFIHYVRSHPASASLQSVDAPRRRETCIDSARCFIATHRRARAARVTGDSYSWSSRAQIGIVFVSHSVEFSQLSTLSILLRTSSRLRLEVCKLSLHSARSDMFRVLRSYLVMAIGPVPLSACRQLYF